MSSPPDTPAEQAAFAARVQILLDNHPSTLIVNLGVALIFLFLERSHLDATLLAAWFSLLVMSVGIRAVLTLVCRHQGLTPDNAPTWAWRFTWGALTAGMTWGAAGLMLPLGGNSGFALFILGGLAAGAIAVNAAILRVYLAFVLPMMIPLACYFFLQGNTPDLIKGGLTTFFLLIMWIVARHHGQVLREALLLSLEHQRISDELRLHRDHLQDLVEHRTEALDRAKQTAEAASMAKSEFLANISHELRTPMHAILSFATIGNEQADSAERTTLAEYFSYIHNSGKRLLALVNDLLDLSKYEARRMQFDIRRHDLRELVETVRDELSSLLKEKTLTLELHVDTPAPYAACDALRIQQVVRNLVSNAIKFSPAGSRILVRLEDDLLDAATGTVPGLAVRVQDEGIGIPESELESIFDKFVQSTKTKSGAGGTGLGLAICKEIVEAHGGTIRAHNRLQSGAELRMVLPVELLPPGIQEDPGTAGK